MPNELRPCPFCGGEAVLKIETERIGFGGNVAYHFVECKRCGASSKRFGPLDADTELERKLNAIFSWNRTVTMEMRDRLIDNKEYAKQMRENAVMDENGIIRVSIELWEQISDIIDRSIIPPCKVGDTVFYIDTCETAEDFGKKFVSFSKVKRISVDYEYVVLADHMIVLWRGVFLTKEEAEKALKERDDNG